MPSEFMTDTPTQAMAAMLEHLTGPSRGTCSWITSGTAVAWLTPENRLEVGDPDDAPPEQATPAARFRRTETGFEIEAPQTTALWVNGRAVRSVTLLHGDMIEFGETGPLSRFRVYDAAHRPTMTLTDIFGDTVSYMRSSRRPWRRRVPRAMADVSRRLIWDTTRLFRVGVLVALATLAVAAVLQYRAADRLRSAVESGGFQIESIAAALDDARREAIRESDLKALNDELRARMAINAERLQTLEDRSDAATRIISDATGSVAFLQGGYGLRDTETGRMLRQVVDKDGVPLLLPGGQPLLSLDGTGPVAEVQFNGTGFLLKGAGILVTNRHVARPWEKKPGMRDRSDKLMPAMTRFIAYFPGRSEPVEVTELRLSEEADVAVLALAGGGFGGVGLELANAPPLPGEEIIVMGYPTGLMSLLAQSGATFIEDLRSSGETGFWEVAARLAGAGLIAPLSSGGIIGQATSATIVYDAETTHGGSGGPVLNRNGQVVAINTAIIPEFGGSNLGVPVGHILPLLADLPPDG